MTAPPPADLATAAAITAAGQSAAAIANQIALGRLRKDVTTRLRAQWLGLGRWDAPTVAQFAADAALRVGSAQRQISAMTAATVAAQRRDALGRAVSTPRIATRNYFGANLRNGANPVDVYSRPGHQVWRELSQGKSIEDAVNDAGRYIDTLARTDMELAQTYTARDVGDQDREVIGYRRILVGEYDCALCIVASTFFYKRGNLMPIHPNCDCAVGEVYEGHDFTPSDELLAAVHDTVQQTFGTSDPGARSIDYRKIIIAREHGELGPLLTVASNRFTKADRSKIPAFKVA